MKTSKKLSPSPNKKTSNSNKPNFPAPSTLSQSYTESPSQSKNKSTSEAPGPPSAPTPTPTETWTPTLTPSKSFEPTEASPLSNQTSLSSASPTTARTDFSVKLKTHGTEADLSVDRLEVRLGLSLRISARSELVRMWVGA